MFVVVVAATAYISRSDASTAIVAAVGTALIVMWQALETACAASAAEEGLRGAADSVRFAEDAQGLPWFLECNPAGQWGWLEDFLSVS